MLVAQSYCAADFRLDDRAIYVFDYDGVVISRDENDIFGLSQQPGEEPLLATARSHFQIHSDGMQLPYQRHLIYQAALLANGRESARGPAFDSFDIARRAGKAFILTARSGWHATERVRKFLSASEPYPIEHFHVGRVSKHLQLAQLLEEYPDRDIMYFEDSDKHIDEVREYFSSKPQHERLHVFRVPGGPKKTDDDLWAAFKAELEKAMSAKQAQDAKDAETKLIERWQRFNQASSDEKRWMHERFNWLAVSQPLLFTALVYLVKASPQDSIIPANEVDEVTLGVIGVGIVTSTMASIGLAAAGRMHWRWTTNIIALAHKLNKAARDPVVPFGLGPDWPARTSSVIAPALAISMAFAWIAVAWHLKGLTYMLKAASPTGVLFILVLFCTAFLGPMCVRIVQRTKPETE